MLHWVDTGFDGILCKYNRVLVLLAAGNYEPFHILYPSTSVFWYSLSISGLSWYLILYIRLLGQYFICTSFLIYLFVFLCLSIFSFGTLLFNILFYFLDFLFIRIFDITVALQDFPKTLLFCMQYLMFNFPHIFLLYTVSQILSYHRISVSLPVISFLDFHDVFFLEDSNLSLALQTFAPFLINMALLALAVHWTCINCNWKYRVIG